MKNTALLIKCIALSSLLDPELTFATIAALSHRHRTAWPVHWLSQIAIARTIGWNSFTVMCTSLHAGGHLSWNHSPSAVWAPQPHEPEASDVIVAACPALVALSIMPVPFHLGRKMAHQIRSDLNPASSLIWWCGFSLRAGVQSCATCHHLCRQQFHCSLI